MIFWGVNCLVEGRTLFLPCGKVILFQLQMLQEGCAQGMSSLYNNRHQRMLCKCRLDKVLSSSGLVLSCC